MNTTKRLLVILAITVLGFSLSGMVGAHIANKTIRNRDVVKSWFERSNFYDSASNIIAEKVTESTTESAGIILKDDPEIKTIIKAAFSTEMVKTNVENFINAVYSWLDGTSPKLSFSVDLLSAQQQIAEGLSVYTSNRVSSLPACSDLTTGENFDVFSATCRPSMLSASEAGRLVKESILGQGFLENAVFTSKDLIVTNSDGTKVPFEESEAANGIKAAYRQSASLLVIFALFSIASAAGILFFSITKRRGLLWMGLVFIANGLSLLFFYSITGGIIDAIRNNLVATSSMPATTTLMIDFVRAITSDIRSAMTGYTAAFIGIGTVCLIGFFWGRGAKTIPEAVQDDPSATSPIEQDKKEVKQKKENDSI